MENDELRLNESFTFGSERQMEMEEEKFPSMATCHMFENSSKLKWPFCYLLSFLFGLDLCFTF